MSHRVYVGLGSNVGESRKIVLGAAAKLSQLLSHCRLSSLYRSEPVGVTSQPLFLNAVVTGDYDGSADSLLTALHAIERSYGRNRAHEKRWGPRAVDLDILLFGEALIDNGRLAVPHPRMHRRAFVLVPLLELSPSLKDPRGGTPFAEHLRAVGREGVYYEEAPPYTH